MTMVSGTIVIRFIVNGEELPLEVWPNQFLDDLVRIVLEKTGNTGRPAGEWEVRTEAGVLIPDLHKQIESFHFANFMKLYTTLKVGAGGHAHRSVR